jgi:raffinose/stachyose/melibiose transport system permease protein
MTVPAMLLFFAFHTFPALQGLFYSFTNWKGYGAFVFVGIKNYANIFIDPDIGQAYGFTFKYAIASTILVNVLSLALALCLNANIRARPFFRALYFLPNVLGALVVGYVFKYIFSNVMPSVGQDIGVPFLQRNILGSMKSAWTGVVIVTTWQAVAFNTLLYITGLQGVSEELYEAATIDGASKAQSFWKITLPLLAPFVTINLVYCMKNSLMVFDPVMALTGGGPGKATTSVSVAIYKGGFSGSLFAYQSANAMLFFVILVAVSLVQIKSMQGKERKANG